MKCYVVVMVLALLILAAEGVPSRFVRRASDLYFKRSGEAPASPKFNVKLMGTNSGRVIDPDFVPYQKYVACVSRTFKFEKCTLCYCTDLPNIALCWDYEGEQCDMVGRLVEEQKYGRNQNNLMAMEMS